MARFSELMARMSPERQARAAAGAKELLRDMPLRRLRVDREVGEDELASAPGIRPARVLILERRTDRFLSEGAKVR